MFRMMLRQRLVATGLLAAIPATAVLAWSVERARAHDRETAVTRFVTAQLNDQVRERCEGDPTWFLTGPLLGRPPGGVFVPANEDDLPPRPRVEPQPFELFAYDSRFVGSSSATPRLPEELRRVLRFQAAPTPVVAPHVTEAGTGVQVAVATTWTGGPCTYLLARLEAPPNQARNRLLTILGIFIVTLAVAMATMIPTVWRIRRLARDARAAVDANHSAIAPDSKHDELSSLTFVINDSSQALHERRARIDDLNSSLRRSVDVHDAEIVKPLVALESAIASLASRPNPTQQDIGALLEQSHTLAAQVGNVVATERLRTLGQAPARTVVDLSSMLALVVTRHRAFADVRRVRLTVSLPSSPVTIEADAALVELALANVIDNAVRYSQPGGAVTVELVARPADKRFVLRVLDNGPGLSDEQFKTMTAIRRFRGDEGRNRRPGAPGLGLSVAREICDRYGITIELERPEGGGLAVELAGTTAG